MSDYKVNGNYYPGGKKRSFTKEVEAESENLARERIFTNFGSKHRLKRNQIEINEVEEL